MDPDSLDAAELNLDDSLTDLSTYIQSHYPGDARLHHLVDAVVLHVDEVLDALDGGAHLELDFDPNAVEH